MATFETTNQLTLLELARPQGAGTATLATIAEVLSKDQRNPAGRRVAGGQRLLLPQDRAAHDPAQGQLPQAERRRRRGPPPRPAKSPKTSRCWKSIPRWTRSWPKWLRTARPSATARPWPSWRASTSSWPRASSTMTRPPIPRTFTGLAPRLDDLSLDNVLGAGGSGDDLTSVYVVGLGPSQCVPSSTPRARPRWA